MGCWVFRCYLTNDWITAEQKQKHQVTFQEKSVTKNTKVNSRRRYYNDMFSKETTCSAVIVFMRNVFKEGNMN